MFYLLELNPAIKQYLFLFLLICSGSNYSQQDTVLERFRKEADSPVNDSNKVRAQYRLSWRLLQHGQLDEATSKADEMLALATKLNFKKGIAWANHTHSVILQEHGDYPGSLLYALKALKTREEINNLLGITESNIAIGNIYGHQKEYQTALDYYGKAVQLSQQINSKSTTATCYMNMGIVYRKMKQLDKALEYQLKALRISEETNDAHDITSVNIAIANIYMETGKYDEALKKHQEVLKYAQSVDARETVALSYGNIGAVYYLMKDAGKAIYYLKEGVRRSKAIGMKNSLVNDYEALAAADSLAGNFKEALENYKMYVLYKDSLTNEENTKKITQAQMQYVFDKKAAEDKAVQEKKDALAAEQLKQHKVQRNYFIAGFVLVLLLAVFITYSFLQKRKANRLLEEKNLLIENQKAIVEMKQSEILDSIRYAKRIQSALVTSEYYINKELHRLNSKKH